MIVRGRVENNGRWETSLKAGGGQKNGEGKNRAEKFCARRLVENPNAAAAQQVANGLGRRPGSGSDGPGDGGCTEVGSGVVGKGMEAKEWGLKVFVFIPLPPFLCQFRCGDWVFVSRGQARARWAAVAPTCRESERRDAAAWANFFGKRREVLYQEDRDVWKRRVASPREVRRLTSAATRSPCAAHRRRIRRAGFAGTCRAG